jgi:hypothetical protein
VNALILVPTVLLILWMIAIISSRRKAKLDSIEGEPFTISPFTSWFIIGGSLGILTTFFIISFHDLISNPSNVPLFVFLTEGLFVASLAIGLYSICPYFRKAS